MNVWTGLLAFDENQGGKCYIAYMPIKIPLY